MPGSLLAWLVIASPALVLPLILGIIVLRMPAADRFARFAGWFTLKPVLATPIWAFVLSLGARTWMSAPSQTNVNAGLIPAISLTLIIVLIFRDQFRSAPLLTGIFLAADVGRWLSTYLWLSSVNLTGLFLFLRLGLEFLAFALPSAYAIMALIIVERRTRQAAARRGTSPSTADRS